MNLPPHGKYGWLPSLYNVVKTFEPKKIIELGPGTGTTTVTMALACKENNIDVTINSYDIWNDSYWGNYQVTMDTYKKWDILDCVNLYEKNFYDWVKTDEDFDLLYFDIDNNSSKILDLYNKVRPQIENGSVVLFEGGSDVRPGFDLAKEKTNYKVLTDNIKYSLSIIYGESKWSLGY